MAIQHALNWSYQAGGNSLSANLTASSEQENNLDVVIAPAATNYQVAFSLSAARSVGFFMIADAAMTVKTNSSGSPTQTFTLAAGIPIAWMTGAGSNPVTSDITTLYITSTSGGNLQIRSLQDGTP